MFINLLCPYKNFLKHFSENLDDLGFDKIISDIWAGDNYCWEKTSYDLNNMV